MFRLQMAKLVDVLIEKGINKSEDKEIIVYGLASGIELVFNIITTIVLGFVFGQVVESLVFLISFSLIRTYAGGYHCRKALNCYLFSSGIVILVLAIVKFTPKWSILFISITMLLISVPIFLNLAPMETPTKPLDKEEQTYYRKKMMLNLSIQCTVILVLCFSKLNRFSFVVCLGILVSAGLVFLQQIQIKLNEKR